MSVYLNNVFHVKCCETRKNHREDILTLLCLSPLAGYSYGNEPGSKSYLPSATGNTDE